MENSRNMAYNLPCFEMPLFQIGILQTSQNHINKTAACLCMPANLIPCTHSDQTLARRNYTLYTHKRLIYICMWYICIMNV